MRLTRVWRFGGEIAEKSTALLSTIYKRLSPLPVLIGRGATHSRVMSYRAWEQLIASRTFDDPGMIITRKNAGVMKEALKMSMMLGGASSGPSQRERNQKTPIHCLMDNNDLFKVVDQLAKLRNKKSESEKIYGCTFRRFEDAERWAEEEEHDNLIMFCDVAKHLSGEGEGDVSNYDTFVKPNLDRCKKMCTLKKKRPSRGTYRYLISNTHQMKGGEEDTVFLGEDFANTLQAFRGGDSHRRHMGVPRDSKWLNDENNLVYVAMTRAKKVLVLNRDLDRLFYKIQVPPILVLRRRNEGALAAQPAAAEAAAAPAGAGGAAAGAADAPSDFDVVIRSRPWVRVPDAHNHHRRRRHHHHLDFDVSVDRRYLVERDPLVLRTGVPMTMAKEGAGIPDALAGGECCPLACLVSSGGGGGGGGEAEEDEGADRNKQKRAEAAVPAGLLLSAVKFWGGHLPDP